MAPLPAYQQVKRHIMQHIESGDWQPGDRVPSERELVRLFAISRMTVNRAVRELTRDGRLIRLQGKGTYVAEPKAGAALLEILPIDEEIATRGARWRAEVITLAREPAAEDVAHLLHLNYGGSVFHAVVVHYQDDVALQLEERYVNPAVACEFLDQDFTRTTPSQYLLDTVPVSEVEHVIEAARPAPREADLLGIAADEPCLVLTRRTWANGDVVTRVRLTSPGHLRRLGGRFTPYQ